MAKKLETDKTDGAPNASDSPTPPPVTSPTPPLPPSPPLSSPPEVTSAPAGNLVARKRVGALDLRECREELIRLGDPIGRRKALSRKIADVKAAHATTIDTMRQKERDLEDEFQRTQDVTQVEALRITEIGKRIAALEAQAKKDAESKKNDNQLA